MSPALASVRLSPSLHDAPDDAAVPLPIVLPDPENAATRAHLIVLLRGLMNAIYRDERAYEEQMSRTGQAHADTLTHDARPPPTVWWAGVAPRESHAGTLLVAMRQPFHWQATPAVAHRSRTDGLTQDSPLGARPSTSEAAWAALRRTVAEALILQDAAEDLLATLHDRPDPADAARSCGRLTRRFAELREELPSGDDPEIDLCTRALQQVLDHHILLLKTSLGFLAGAARSERLAERLDAVDGLGHPARRLETIRFYILWRTSRGDLAAVGLGRRETLTP